MEDAGSPAAGLHAPRRALGDVLGAWASPGSWEPGAALPLTAAKVAQSVAACGSPYSGGTTPPGSIRAAYGGGGPTPSAKEAAVQEALQADYRAQFKQYVAQLAAKETEATSLRQQLQDAKLALGSATAGRQDASEAAARSAAQLSALETHICSLEQQLQQREQDAGLADRHRAAAEQEAAAARAAAAAAQKSVATKCQEWEESRRYYKEQLEAKDAQIQRLEEAVQRQAAEAERKAREWAQREVDLSQAHAQNKDSAVAIRSQLSVAQDKLDQSLKRAKALESANAELRKQKAQMLADMKMLEDLLADSDNERREMHEKYVIMGERMEALVKEEQAIKEAAQMESEAARLAVQEAVRDAESAVNERGSLRKKIQELKEQLDAEQASRGKLQEKVQHKLTAAEQEMAYLKTELESKIKQLKGLQADMKAMHADAESKLDACEAQMSSLKSRITILTRELETEKKRAGQAKEEADTLWQERLKVEQQQQALKYERRIQELEMQYAHGVPLPRSTSSVSAVAAAATTILDYIPRSEHVRVLESRLAAKESDMTVELNSRINQTEREWQWKLDGKEQEISSLTSRLRQLEDDLHGERQRSTSHSHKLTDENKRLQAQCVELQRDLDAAQKEFTRLKESLKDARLANAGMDDDQMTASRQVARLKHVLEESHTALKEAQLALDKERKHAEGCERELEQHKARVEDAYRKLARLEAEVAELTSALEQKQEVIAALQTENANWSAKLMAHRDWHDQETEALRRQLKQESEEKLGPLEQQCALLAAELRELKQRHDEELFAQGTQHAAHVGQLEKQLAAAERCAAELKELSKSLTGIKQDDLEMMKSHIQDLQLKLKESHQQRGKERREHQAQLSALEAQIKSKLAAFKAQHKTFRAQVQGDLINACSSCQHEFDSGLAALKQQVLESWAAAAQAQDASATHIGRLRDSLSKVVAIVSKECGLPAGLDQTLADAAGSSDSEAASRALQQVAAALRHNAEQSSVAAANAVLCPLEDCLLAAGVGPGSSSDDEPRPARWRRRAQPQARLRSPRSRSQSPKKQQQPSLSPRKVPSRLLALSEPPLSCLPEGMATRVEVLASRCQELLADLATNDEQIVRLQQKIASYDSAFSQAKAESVLAAETAHEAAVNPLREEVARLQERVRELSQQHTSEVVGIEAMSRQQLADVRAQAQSSIDQATAQSRQLQSDLHSERQRGEGAAAELARAQDELAKQSQRAASKIELQDKELSLLKERIREMELRDHQNSAELRVLKQREREAQLDGSIRSN